MITRRIVSVLAGVVLAVAAPFAAVAATSSPPPPTPENQPICDDSGAGLCLYSHYPQQDGAFATMYAWQNDYSSELYLNTSFGVVTGNYPFKVGLGLNKEFAGDDVIQWAWSASPGYCLGLDIADNSEVVNKDCSGGDEFGTIMVQAATGVFVDVAASNYTQGIPQYLCGAPATQPAFYEDFQSGVCNWKFEPTRP